MNGVADSSSLNKPIKINLNIYMHIFYFFIYFFGAGLDPASPARSVAQANDPAGQHEARVN
jgi:hypothetical protein